MKVRRGVLYWVDLPTRHTEGQEYGNHPHADGTESPRPWLVVSAPQLSSRKIALACPASTAAARRYDPQRTYDAYYRVLVEETDIKRVPGARGVPRRTVILCDQVRVMSLDRFRQPLGQVEEHVMDQVDLALMTALDLKC